MLHFPKVSGQRLRGCKTAHHAPLPHPRSVLSQRLLHAGASASSIIHTYISTIKVLTYIEQSGECKSPGAPHSSVPAQRLRMHLTAVRPLGATTTCLLRRTHSSVHRNTGSSAHLPRASGHRPYVLPTLSVPLLLSGPIGPASLLSAVAEPICLYLRSRPDTVKCLVAMVTQGGGGDGGEEEEGEGVSLLEELRKVRTVVTGLV